MVAKISQTRPSSFGEFLLLLLNMMVMVKTLKALEGGFINRWETSFNRVRYFNQVDMKESKLKNFSQDLNMSMCFSGLMFYK